MKYSNVVYLSSNNPMESEGKLWPTYSREFQLYATLNAEDSRIQYGPRAVHCAFWNVFIPSIEKHEREIIQGIIGTTINLKNNVYYD